MLTDSDAVRAFQPYAFSRTGRRVGADPRVAGQNDAEENQGLEI